MKRLIVNGLLASAIALAIAIGAGVLNLDTLSALAANVTSVVESNPKGATATISSTYTGTTTLNYVVNVTKVTNGGQISGIDYSVNGGHLSKQISVNGTNPVSIGNDTTIAFSGSGGNAVGDTFTFAVKPPPSCNKKSKC